MVAEIESSGYQRLISSKAVKMFPSLFRGTYKAIFSKASRWLKERHTFLSSAEEEIQNISHRVKRRRATGGRATRGRKVVRVKAQPGRGRKQELWSRNVQTVLFEDFQRLSKAGLKFNSGIVAALAKKIVLDAEGAQDLNLEGRDRTEITAKITKRWVQSFMDRFGIVSRRQCGKLLVSPAKEVHIEREVAYHLGQVYRGFKDVSLEEDMVENMDETHFMVNMDDGKTLSVIGSQDVRYADVSSGGVGMTMVVRITGGRDASIQPPLMIFENNSRSYPIRCVADDVPGVSYRTGPKGWMDQQVFLQWLSEPRAIKKDTYGRKRTIFLDNCSGHNSNFQQLQQLNAINSELSFCL